MHPTWSSAQDNKAICSRHQGSQHILKANKLRSIILEVEEGRSEVALGEQGLRGTENVLSPNDVHMAARLPAFPPRQPVCFKLFDTGVGDLLLSVRRAQG